MPAYSDESWLPNFNDPWEALLCCLLSALGNVHRLHVVQEAKDAFGAAAERVRQYAAGDISPTLQSLLWFTRRPCRALPLARPCSY